MPQRLRLPGCLLALALSAHAVDFNRDVRPILSDNCFTCHGPDDQHRKAGLRLDTRDGAFAKAGVIQAGDSAHSRLFQRLSAPKAKRMPPTWAGMNALTPQQIEIIGKWINEGAKWETHWAYAAPKRPDPPPVSKPAWVRNPIDAFILARLDMEGLKPSPEADRPTLIRRLSYDLTGLPPTPAEVDAFLRDRSPNAYEKVVDRLLASPHYGERMAMQWMDFARYADTHGYHIDSHRDMWPWRDWVVRAFNRNQPFDQFTIDQLAGDLLPKPTQDQLIATGFNRNHMINFEGGAIPEEYHVEYVVDRVEATANTWMSMTMGCARCHDHKYDPIKQRDFYRFFAFFNNVDEKGLDGRRGNALPMLQLPSPEQSARLEKLKAAIEAHTKALPEPQVAAAQQRWEQTAVANLGHPARQGLLSHYAFDGSLADSSGNYRDGRLTNTEVSFSPGPVDNAAEFDGETEADIPDPGPFATGAAFTVALHERYSSKETALLQKVDSAGRGFEIVFDDQISIPIQRRFHLVKVSLTGQAPDAAIRVRTRTRVPQGNWRHITVTYDGSGKAAGLTIYFDGKPQPVDILADRLAGSFATTTPLTIGNKKTGQPFKGRLDDLRFYSRVLTPAEIEQLAVFEPLRSALLRPEAIRTKEQKALLREYFLTQAGPENYRQLYAELNERKKQQAALEDEIPNTMVMRELDKPRPTFVLARGDYRNQTEKVTPGVPAVLPPLPKDAPLNRLTLARWLVDPAHPLTARVAVNRYWQMYFGLGIVKTAEDFGAQGEPPVHPELLDWLATEFVRSGWDIRAMQRLIVTSATYRQASPTTPELIEKDPENRLLAHGPRFRLPAEVIRDNALAVSGLLDATMGGKGVNPYQPAGVWEDIAYGDGFTAQEYAQDHGAALHRRSLYTFWKRTAPPPEMITFDAPDREKCSARRVLTNTPLQALVLMNDPTFMEAARALATRAITEGGRTPAQRVDYAFRLVTARKPTAQERRVLVELAARNLAHYRSNDKAAAELTKVGESDKGAQLDRKELAAWTTVASAMLNMDEAITKE